MEDFEEHEWGAGRSYLSIGKWQGEGLSYRESLYRHEFGLVEVYESMGASRCYTNLRFRYQGRDYSRSWKTYWGDKTIARLARELVESVVQ
jgi:hypothetical protein